MGITKADVVAGRAIAQLLGERPGETQPSGRGRCDETLERRLLRHSVTAGFGSGGEGRISPSHQPRCAGRRRSVGPLPAPAVTV